MPNSSAELFEAKDEHSEQSFEGLEKRNAELVGRTYESCTFRTCNFGGADFSRARILHSTFDRCDLSNSKLNGAVLRELNFRGCKLMGINFSMASALSLLVFEECVLDYASFVGLDLPKTVFRKCKIHEGDFADANLTESDCRESDFAGTRFSRTNLSKADLRGALNYSIRPDENTLKKARFSLPEATLLLYGLDILLEE